MAFNDTLFQLGMDLTRSSTAQKEDYSCVESDADTVDRTSIPATTQSNIVAGTTLFIDLHGAKRLDDAKSVERAIKRAVEGFGMKLKSVHLDRVAGGGVTGVAKLATGHLSLQACSRSGLMAVDARGCAGLKPEAALIALANAFEAREAVIQKVRKAQAIALPTLRIVPQNDRKMAKTRSQAKAA
ncbi:MAG: S-adenosylmethionine decarboxylase [Hyphomicrobium sp.]|nr:MAG: S-adenosylmethionine decarboxylase [Hyphomicrobium sp.]